MRLIFASLAKIPHKNIMSFSVNIKEFMISIYHIFGDVDLDRLVKKVSAGFLPCKVTIFPSAVDKYFEGDTLKL